MRRPQENSKRLEFSINCTIRKAGDMETKPMQQNERDQKQVEWERNMRATCRAASVQLSNYLAKLGREANESMGRLNALLNRERKVDIKKSL